MDGVEWGASQLEWQRTSRMGDLFGKVHLKVPYDLPTGLAPSTHRRIIDILGQLPTLIEDLILRFGAPLGEGLECH